MITDLLTWGLSIDTQDPVYRQTALMYACKRGHASTAEKLLELGASINIINARESTALFEAVQGDQAEILALLLKYDDLNVNAKYPNVYHRTALSIAVWNELDQIINLLLERSNLLVNEKDVHGWIALVIAAQAITPIFVETLLSHTGFDVNCVDNQNQSPVIIAARNGLEEDVQALLEGEADTYMTDISGGTGILRAIDYGNTSIVERMIRYGVDIFGLDNYERTLLTAPASMDRLRLSNC